MFLVIVLQSLCSSIVSLIPLDCIPRCVLYKQPCGSVSVSQSLFLHVFHVCLVFPPYGFPSCYLVLKWIQASDLPCLVLEYQIKEIIKRRLRSIYLQSTFKKNQCISKCCTYPKKREKIANTNTIKIHKYIQTKAREYRYVLNLSVSEVYAGEENLEDCWYSSEVQTDKMKLHHLKALKRNSSVLKQPAQVSNKGMLGQVKCFLSSQYQSATQRLRF